MKRTLIILGLTCFVLSAHTQDKVSMNLLINHSRTTNDYYRVNNKWLIGAAARISYKNATKFSPLFELSGDRLIIGKDVMLRDPDPNIGSNPIRYVVNAFGGIEYRPIDIIYLSFLAGPSYINERFLMGIKPTAGIYFSKRQRWNASFSYTTIFNRTKVVNQHFETINFALGLRLF